MKRSRKRPVDDVAGGIAGSPAGTAEKATESQAEGTKPRAEPAPESSHGVMRLLAGGFLGLGVGLALLGAAAAYLGAVVPGSLLISISIVMITLYLFIRFWPEEEKPAVLRSPGTTPPLPKRRAMVSVVREDGPPRARVMMALRDLVKKEGEIRLSSQGAERFARTIRFILQSDETRGR